MSDKKHTPGPWFDWENMEWIHEPKKLLANYEDACLMATAPDLLEALEVMLQEPWLFDSSRPKHWAQEQARAAIKKAKAE